MNVVLFINSMGSGGAEHQLAELADGLLERGHTVTVASWSDIADHYDLNPKAKRIIIAKGKPNVVKMIAIWWFFLTVKTDCVIGFGQRASQFMLAPIKYRLGKHICAIAGERNTTVGEPTRYERELMSNLYRRADYIVPNSNAQCKHIIEKKPEYETKTITITNYTDLTTYKKAPLPGGEALKICVFARYNTQKNCQRFVEAVKQLHERTSQKFIIDWYGNQRFKDVEPNPHYVAMKEKVDEYGLQECLHLNDHIKDVASAMQSYDAFCLPSLSEGFSNAVSEAICCGRPCLVSDVADNGVMVYEGENGFLFNPYKVDSIVEAFFKYFALSKEERQLMGDNSRKRAEDLFNRERFISAYERLINREVV